MFTIVPDRDRALLSVKLSGFFTVEEVAAFAQAAQNTVGIMGWREQSWYHLCDVTDMTLQSQDVAKALVQFTNHPTRRSRKLAIVSGRGTIRMQARRLLTRDDGGLFDTVADAEAWLFSDAPAQAAAPQPEEISWSRG